MGTKFYSFHIMYYIKAIFAEMSLINTCVNFIFGIHSNKFSYVAPIINCRYKLLHVNLFSKLNVFILALLPTISEELDFKPLRIIKTC